MKKTLLTGIAASFLATGTAHAMYIDAIRGRCFLSDHSRVHCSDLYGKNWRKIFKEWVKIGQPGARPPFPEEGPVTPINDDTWQWKCTWTNPLDRCELEE